MLSGFYTAGSGILNQQRAVNVIGNNIANNQTAGYKSQRLVSTTFEQNFLNRLENGVYTPIGQGDPAVIADVVDNVYDESYLKETESTFDMAIVGEGFFNIAGNNNTYLTRNGNFNIDAQGYIVLDGIGRVQGRNGDILVRGSDFKVTPHGLVYDNDGNYVDRLLITTPADGAQTKRLDNGMYISDQTDISATAVVYQNHLEQSNVDMNQEYTKLIEAQRALQASASALKIIDTMNSKAATISSIT